jgi:hypothetical protein
VAFAWGSANDPPQQVRCRRVYDGACGKPADPAPPAAPCRAAVKASPWRHCTILGGLFPELATCKPALTLLARGCNPPPSHSLSPLHLPTHCALSPAGFGFSTVSVLHPSTPETYPSHVHNRRARVLRRRHTGHFWRRRR